MSKPANEMVVRIIETATGKVELEMGPMLARAAEKVARGASINLDHQHYHVTIEPKKSPPPARHIDAPTQRGDYDHDDVN